MKKTRKSEALKKNPSRNTKVAGFTISKHAGPVACTVTRSKKGVVLRCEFDEQAEEIAAHGDLAGDLEGAEAPDGDGEIVNTGSNVKVLTDSALAGEQDDEAPADEQDDEDVE